MGAPTVFFPPSIGRFAPHRLPPAWTEHGPVAYDLVAALRPALVVAVGARQGATYFACCQAVRELDVQALCYAVGEWAEPASPEGEPRQEALDDFATHGRAFYADLSYILRLAPDEALPQFDEGTIDLLLLDEEFGGPVGADADGPRPPSPDVADDGAGRVAGRRDAQYRSWLARVRPGGVVLVHDIGREGSPLREWWRRLEEEYPTLSFGGSPALGVLRVPGPAAPDERHLSLLFEPEARSREAVRATYARAARFLELGESIGAAEFGHARRNRQGRAGGAP